MLHGHKGSNRATLVRKPSCTVFGGQNKRFLDAAELGKESPSPLETFLKSDSRFLCLLSVEGGVCSRGLLEPGQMCSRLDL